MSINAAANNINRYLYHFEERFNNIFFTHIALLIISRDKNEGS